MGRKLIIPKADFSAVAVSSLPIEYEELTAIVTSGTQYIDSGVNAESGVAIELDVSGFTFGGNASSWLCGARHQSGGSTYSFGILANHSLDYYRFDNGGLAQANINTDSPSRTKFFLSGTKGKVGETEVSLTEVSFDLGNNMYLFTTQKDGTPDTAIASVTCYGVKMWKDGSIVRNLLPAKRIADNEIGLYDIVNDVFYTNDGSGSFTGF